MGRAVRSFASRDDDRARGFNSVLGAKQGKNARFRRDEALSAKGVDPVGEAHLHNREAERIYRELTREAEERYAAERAAAAAAEKAAAAAAKKAAAAVVVPGVVAAPDANDELVHQGEDDTADAAVAEEGDGDENDDTEEDEDEGGDVLIAVNAASDSVLGEKDIDEEAKRADAAFDPIAVNAATVSAVDKEDDKEVLKRASAVGEINDDKGVAFVREAMVASAVGADKEEEVQATGNTAGVAEEGDGDEGGDTKEDEDGGWGEDILVTVNAASDSALDEKGVDEEAQRAGEAAVIFVAVNAAAVSAEDDKEELKCASAVVERNDYEEGVAFVREASVVSAVGGGDEEAEQCTGNTAGIAVAGDDEEGHGAANAAGVAVAVDAASAPSSTRATKF
ncbi:nucleolin-like [Panicum virgatum]|uniref:Uncharacterized protein n=1 Tax=Panicum virgatum TaxID=38727 RepID=A0A8T0VYL8_PANVG|nr:nucleolin-like [Panicum virgatum]KAG2638766.1 hypothetical protein PVAP13_2NG642401 [Panicum virgatum]